MANKKVKLARLKLSGTYYWNDKVKDAWITLMQYQKDGKGESFCFWEKRTL